MMKPTNPIHRRDFLKSGLHGAAALGGLGLLSSGISCSQNDSSRNETRVSTNGSNTPTIVVITLDTTRADHLGCYGYSLPTSPNIDRFAEDAQVYTQAIAPGTWTLPSHASLFTGKFASSHGARKDPDGALHLTNAISGPQSWSQIRVRTIASNEQTLASLLKGAGYRTGAVVAGPWLKSVFGLAKGFDDYDEENLITLNGRMAEAVTERALAWFDKPAEQPRFLFLNYFDAHFPLKAPVEFSKRFVPADIAFVEGSKLPPEVRMKRRVARYDAEICYMDHHVGKLFDGLKERGLYDDAWIIVTADHGHLFGEHGQTGHGGVPYQEIVHIPQIVKLPGAQHETGSVSNWTQLTDILPMILDRLEIPIPAGIQGSIPTAIDHPIVMESRTLEKFDRNGSWTAMIDRGMKILWNTKGKHMLFDLEVDPAEEHDLFDERPEEAKKMGSAINDYLAGLPKPGEQAPAQQVDQETIKALKSIGYLK